MTVSVAILMLFAVTTIKEKEITTEEESDDAVFDATHAKETATHSDPDEDVRKVCLACERT